MSAAQSRVVLVVDGDAEIGALFQRAARDLELHVTHALTADEGWKLCLSLRPMAVFTDYRLVGFDGLSLLTLVGRYFPLAKRILHTAEKVARPGVALDIPVLGKPCEESALRELLSALDGLSAPRMVTASSGR